MNTALFAYSLSSGRPRVQVDGVRLVFPDGWGLLRASNSGPILVLRVEAESEKRPKEIQALLEATLEKMKKRV